MKEELPKIYDPKKVEDKIYEKWEKSGYFNPDNLDISRNAPSFTIVLPPPNITDKLHLGHSSTLAIEDLLIRYHRMKGFRTLWVPGTDHAAIATQNVVERKLLKEEGLTRYDLGKDKFLERAWDFLRKTQAIILHQIRKMGASLDWSREAFTLDEQRKKAVQEMFVDMYKAGIIYRGERIVNWCPRCHSTLADDEVEYKAQKTKLYTFRYSRDFPISIATTRPETKLGDTALVVNPQDKRYKNYIGKIYTANFCEIPLKLKIIADKSVDPKFGTGAVGVTPAHSMADWQLAQKNKLEVVKVINEDGKIREGFGEYSGRSAREAREIIIKKLKKQGLLKNEREIEHNLSVCYRCGTPIEPLPSKQWFIAVGKKIKRLGGKSLKEKAIEVAEQGKIKFIPDRFFRTYINWMANLHDWCISRQIWFGHQIPVWYKNEKIYVGEKKPKGKNWKQDPDTLDTWFSSGMWTFSTLGWPGSFRNGKKSGDLLRFHPTQVLETGYEIITLWVSRMIMMSLFALNEIPFEKVYLHGMVLDKSGKKMSKSKGTGIDPLDVIKKFGTDAVRLSLLIGNTPGNDILLGEEKIAGFRNFANKLWNISRYILRLADKKSVQKRITRNNLTLADFWILQKMSVLIQETREDIENFRFSQAGEKLREFTWNDFADWYVEISKFEKTPEKNKILTLALKDLLKLWHPFMPFVTEHVWKQFGEKNLLMVTKWPTEENYWNIASASQTDFLNFELVKEIIKAIRRARLESKIESHRKISVIIDTRSHQQYLGINTYALIHSQENLIRSLRTGIKELKITSEGKRIKSAIHRTVAGINIYIPTKGLVNIKKERDKAKKELENLKKFISGIESRMKNKQFLKKAPKEIIAGQKESLRKAKAKFSEIKKHLEDLG